jgi:cysteinyl-tRNA synthetase
MSKRLGNFFTIRDLVTKGFDPLAIRYALISTRYRESMNFTMKGLYEAAAAVSSLRDLADKLQTSVAAIDEAAGDGTHESALTPQDAGLLDDFSAAMDDDLNISGALGAIFTWSTPLNKQKKIPFPQAQSALLALKKIDRVLAVIFSSLRSLDLETTGKVEALLTRRQQARAGKDFATSDALRNEIHALGVEVKDTPTGQTWRPRLAPMLPPG